MTATEIVTKVIATFPDELALLTPNIREFVVRTFWQRCPDHFWKIPASTSGKYHPRIVLGEGGLVRHVKLAVWWGRTLCNTNPRSVNENHIVAALLLHDLWKNGHSNLKPYLDGKWPKGPEGITGTHGGLLAESLVLDTPLNLLDIVYAVGGHMGRWTDPQYAYYTIGNKEHRADRAFLINTVHQADYCASRRLPEDQR